MRRSSMSVADSVLNEHLHSRDCSGFEYKLKKAQACNLVMNSLLKEVYLS